MSDTMLTILAGVGILATLFSLGLIGLTVFLWARDVRVTRCIRRMGEDRRMERLRELGDRKWSEADAGFEAYERWVESLPIANPWTVI